MKCSFISLGSFAPDSFPNFFLVFPRSKIIFDCGEGSQRFLSEYKMKTSKINKIFLTKNDWNSLGGVFGLVMTIFDTGNPENLELYGPSNITQILKSSKKVLNRSDIELIVKEISASLHCLTVFKDNNYKIDTVSLVPDEIYDFLKKENNQNIENLVKNEVLSFGSPTASPTESNKSETSDEETMSKKRKQPDNFFEDLEKIESCLCYIVESNSSQKFNIQKARELKIPRGPLYGTLVSGNSVTLLDGRIIEPHEVLFPPVLGPIFVLIRCPEEKFLRSLIENPVFLDFKNRTNENIVFAHVISESVLHNPQYKEWVNNLHPKAQHTIYTKETSTNETAFQNSFKLQKILNKIDPVSFGDLYNSLESVGLPSGYPEKTQTVDLMTRLYTSHPLSNGENKIKLTENDMENEINEVFKLPGFKDQVESISKKLPELKENFPENGTITFLGTGSAVPSRYRNVSSTLLEIHSKGAILFDSGEGTYGQIFRKLGPENFKKMIENDLKAIFITHVHADHHLGLIKLLKARGKHLHPLLICGPPKIKLWLNEYSFFDPLPKFFFVGSESIANSMKIKRFKDSLGLTELTSVSVIHTTRAYGYIVANKKWKYVHSGDTRPCPALIEKGMNATVLVHEATFEDELIDDAIEKKHSTTLEAIEVAERMKAKLLVLTHFSQRYPKVPVLDDNKFGVRICTAFDFMSIRMDDLERASHFLSVFTRAFQEENKALVEKPMDEEE